MNRINIELYSTLLSLSLLMLTETLFWGLITSTIFIIGTSFLSYKYGRQLCLEHNANKYEIFILTFLLVGIVIFGICLHVMWNSLIAIIIIKLSGIFISCLASFIILGYAVIKSLEHSFKHPSNDKIYMGHTISKILPEPFFIDEKVRNQHQIIFGTTGSGKTVSVLFSQIEHDIRTGKVIIILYPKGDKKFRDKVFNYCKKHNRDFHYFSITNVEMSNPYNPFLFGSATQIKDKLMSVTEWSEKGDGVHYKKLSELELLLTSIRLKDKITLKKLIENISGDDEFVGLHADLKLLDRSPFSSLMDNEEIGLWQIYNENKVFFVSLDEDSYPVTAQSLGKIILSDLKSLSGYINNMIDEDKRRPVSIFIDEVSTFMSEFMAQYFFNFIAKTRSANISVTMATHSPVGDFEKYGKDIVDRLISLTSTHVIMRNSAPDSADYLAKMIGTIESEKITKQIQGNSMALSTGVGSLRPVDEFKVNPNMIKKLQIGEAYIHISEGDILEPVFLDHYFHDEKNQISYEEYWIQENKKLKIKKEAKNGFPKETRRAINISNDCSQGEENETGKNKEIGNRKDDQKRETYTAIQRT